MGELPEQLGLLNKGEQLLSVLQDARPQALHSNQHLVTAAGRLVLAELHCTTQQLFHGLAGAIRETWQNLKMNAAAWGQASAFRWPSVHQFETSNRAAQERWLADLLQRLQRQAPSLLSHSLDAFAHCLQSHDTP